MARDRLRKISTLLLGCSALTVASSAWGQSNAVAEAQKYFDEARDLMKAGRYAEACPKLQQSQKLDPGMGTKYRLAECYESAGWTGSAWSLFREVAEDAKKGGRADREDQAKKRAAALLPRVPMLTLQVPEATAKLPGLEVKRDGESMAAGDWNRGVPIDPGAHTLAVSAPGHKTWQENVRALEGASLVVAVPQLQAEGSPAGAGPVGGNGTPEAPVDAKRGRTQRIIAIAAGGVGVAGLAIGSVTGLLAQSKWDHAQKGCQGGDLTKCGSTSVNEGSDARSMATVSTIGFIAGGTALAAGVLLWVTVPPKSWPSTGIRFVPSAGPEGAQGTLSGTF